VKEVIITAGPTRQYIDTVRFITNDSSGQQAKRIAEEFIKKKFKVTIVSGPVNIKYPSKCSVIRVVTADEMYKAASKNIKGKAAAVFAAAVCDLKCAASKKKIKKKGFFSLKFTNAVDIAATLSGRAKCVTAGFALEDSLDADEALRKMREKNFDIIVLNILSALSSKRTSGYIIDRREEEAFMFNDASKKSLAGILCEKICLLIN